jgi:hypothetical protein
MINVSDLLIVFIIITGYTFTFMLTGAILGIVHTYTNVYKYKACQPLAAGRWISPDTPASSTN